MAIRKRESIIYEGEDGREGGRRYCVCVCVLIVKEREREREEKSLCSGKRDECERVRERRRGKRHIGECVPLSACVCGSARAREREVV